MTKFAVTLSLIVFFASVAAAQTKIKATALCAPANPFYLIRVGDDPGHAYGLTQGTCEWTTPWEIAGVKNTVGVGTQIQHIKGDTLRAHGTFVDTMTNGDKVSINFEFTLVTTSAGARIEGHKWEFVGGTGKLVGIKGQGTCDAKPVGTDGTFNYECEGQYTLPKS